MHTPCQSIIESISKPTLNRHKEKHAWYDSSNIKLHRVGFPPSKGNRQKAPRRRKERAIETTEYGFCCRFSISLIILPRFSKLCTFEGKKHSPMASEYRPNTMIYIYIYFPRKRQTFTPNSAFKLSNF